MSDYSPTSSCLRVQPSELDGMLSFPHVPYNSMPQTRPMYGHPEGCIDESKRPTDAIFSTTSRCNDKSPLSCQSFSDMHRRGTCRSKTTVSVKPQHKGVSPQHLTTSRSQLDSSDKDSFRRRKSPSLSPHKVARTKRAVHRNVAFDTRFRSASVPSPINRHTLGTSQLDIKLDGNDSYRTPGPLDPDRWRRNPPQGKKEISPVGKCSQKINTRSQSVNSVNKRRNSKVRESFLPTTLGSSKSKLLTGEAGGTRDREPSCPGAPKSKLLTGEAWDIRDRESSCLGASKSNLRTGEAMDTRDRDKNCPYKKTAKESPTLSRIPRRVGTGKQDGERITAYGFPPIDVAELVIDPEKEKRFAHLAYPVNRINGSYVSGLIRTGGPSVAFKKGFIPLQGYLSNGDRASPTFPLTKSGSSHHTVSRRAHKHDAPTRMNKQ